MKHWKLVRNLSNRATARLAAALVIAVLTASTTLAALPALAQGNAPEPVQVQVDDLTESTAADFARGQRRGIAVVGENERARLRGQAGEFVSGEIRLPFPATHLGLHWIIRGGSPESVAVAVRTSRNGHTWSDWYPLTIEAVTELADGREVFAALANGDLARLVAYRVTFAAPDAVELDAVTVTALNAAPAARKPAPTPPPTPPAPVAPVRLTANGQSLDVITREGWGSDESLRFKTVKRVKTEKWPEMYVPVKKIIIHHTATSNVYSDGAAEVRAIYTYHVRTLGWGDIGYNMLVDQYGKVYEGRHGRGEAAYPGREILGDDVVAGHAYAYNYGTTGIAAIGNSSSTDFNTDPAGPILVALENAAVFECARQFIDPTGSSVFLRSDGVWHSPALNNIAGHNDVNATECPGAFLSAWLDTLRTNVAARLSGMASAPSVTVTLQGNTATFSSTSGAASWSLEGWYKAPGEEPISYLPVDVFDPVYYPDDQGARVQEWSTTPWPESETKTYGPLQPGHYTMHVRNDGYEGNVTILIP